VPFSAPGDADASFDRIIAAEYPEITSIAIHPGAIPETELAKASIPEGTTLPDFIIPDTLELAAAVTLHLAAGKADWLNGRCVCARDSALLSADERSVVVGSGA
jgi:hypothetical protein